MQTFTSSGRRALRRTRLAAAVAASFGFAAAANALSIVPNDLLVTASTYTDPGFAAGIALPYSTGANAVAGSAFCASADCSINVWNNATVDANFGVSSGITLQSVNTASGHVDASLDVSALAATRGINLVTSLASKSELAINLTPDGSGLTFMGYAATANQIDVSNSNSFTGSEPGNTDTAAPTSRVIGQLNLSTLALQTTVTGSYSGNNGRAAVLGANGNFIQVQ